jgi:hypothetical protein
MPVPTMTVTACPMGAANVAAAMNNNVASAMTARAAANVTTTVTSATTMSTTRHRISRERERRYSSDENQFS